MAAPVSALSNSPVLSVCGSCILREQCVADANHLGVDIDAHGTITRDAGNILYHCVTEANKVMSCAVELGNFNNVNTTVVLKNSSALSHDQVRVVINGNFPDGPEPIYPLDLLICPRLSPTSDWVLQLSHFTDLNVCIMTETRQVKRAYKMKGDLAGLKRFEDANDALRRLYAASGVFMP